MKKIDVSTPKHPNTFALVDDEDFDRTIGKWRWYAAEGHRSGNLYAQRNYMDNGRKRTQFLHKIILDAGRDKEIDHEDGNGLNCQKSNLRICSHCENMRNKKKHRNSTSKYKGVSWCKNRKKWCVQIYCLGNSMKLGYFDTEINAAILYNLKAKELFGEFAKLNIIP